VENQQRSRGIRIASLAKGGSNMNELIQEIETKHLDALRSVELDCCANNGNQPT
jgi:hypothetical protein